jgi:hypothetical protein
MTETDIHEGCNDAQVCSPPGQNYGKSVVFIIILSAIKPRFSYDPL